MKFEQIFEAMQELANGGNEFYKNAIQEYNDMYAPDQANMRQWLESDFDDFDEEVMTLRTALLLMQYEA